MDVTPLFRRLLGFGVLILCVALILRQFFLERFLIPTGSMAPTLMGNHRRVDCPRCNCCVRVGERAGIEAFCPNCQKGPISLATVPITKGDHILADKHTSIFRNPRRWMLVLFRMFGQIFIKRVIGLPGEHIAIIDGDVFIDGALCRKTFDEAWRMRIPAFNNDHQPKPHGWRRRWERHPRPDSIADESPTECCRLSLPKGSWLVYRNYQLDEGKCLPITNEYAYNGRSHAYPAAVRDFLLCCDVHIDAGDGCLFAALNDGGDHCIVRIPVGRVDSVPMRKTTDRPFPQHARIRTLTTPATVPLRRNRRYRLQLALVDRRLTCRIDGADVIEPIDLPMVKDRSPVVRPFAFGSQGVCATISRVRLYRDVHYTDQGRNGVNGDVVYLGESEYFVLGDNSPNSEDSRYWDSRGVVSSTEIVGRPFLLHFPHRWTRWNLQAPDWRRFGWLR